ncbi:IS3 family transposase, partial [Latilactobacillus curvatus]|nr:IS3 family transposase [Latilactobacillus curvatus]
MKIRGTKLIDVHLVGVYGLAYIHYETAAAVLFEYVHAFYNRKRIHSSLGYQT